ncbi:hypothetical protein CC2G_006545 [Coprinopsis cinerea AmutBmut pab1-1]|nr:hypothetical protein CC2G_006545 [Coprinopsis cinerea AmutBmut pab1-1]
MSRRSSLGARQNDALYEFEAFKKKFLLANKHITKLNSTLSVRIEELNAQIHALNVENLRLRTSEIHLTSELKREREKSRKIMADAEAATLSLTRHLNYLRTTLDIPHEVPTPPTPPSPKARRRPERPPMDLDPDASPQAMRIARPPTVPGICEEEEPISETPPPKRRPSSSSSKSQQQRRLSASNLPLPTNRPTTPAPVVHMDLSVATAFGKRKPVRRQSGLLSVNMQEDEALSAARPASPAFGSPVRLQAGQAELEEEIAAINGEVDVDVVVDQVQHVEKRERRSRKERHVVVEEEEEVEPPKKNRKEKEKVVEEEEHVEPPIPKDRKRRREGDDTAIVTVEAVTAAPFKPKSNRSALQPIDNNDEPPPPPKEFLAPPEVDTETTGRERRARKSVVSYAEPSLKVKMRKPDGYTGPDLAPKKKRTSTTSSKQRGESPAESIPESSTRRSSLEQHAPSPQPEDPEPPAPVRRKKSRPQMYHDFDSEEESDGAEADEEYVPPSSKKWSNVNVEGRSRRGSKKASSDGELRRHSMAV